VARHEPVAAAHDVVEAPRGHGLDLGVVERARRAELHAARDERPPVAERSVAGGAEDLEALAAALEQARRHGERDLAHELAPGEGLLAEGARLLLPDHALERVARVAAGEREDEDGERELHGARSSPKGATRSAPAAVSSPAVRAASK